MDLDYIKTKQSVIWGINSTLDLAIFFICYYNLGMSETIEQAFWLGMSTVFIFDFWNCFNALSLFRRYDNELKSNKSLATTTKMVLLAAVSISVYYFFQLSVPVWIIASCIFATKASLSWATKAHFNYKYPIA